MRGISVKVNGSWHLFGWHQGIKFHQFFLSNTFTIHSLLQVLTATTPAQANRTPAWIMMTASQRASLHLQTFKGKAKVYTCQTCKRSCNLLLALLQSPTANGEQNPKSLGWHEEVPMWPLLSFLFLECFLVSPLPGQQELPSYSNWHTSKRGRTCLPTQETQRTRIQPSGREDALVKEMATHSRILAWIIQWTEEPGGLQPTELQQSDATERRHTQVPPLITLLADHVLPILFIYLNIPYLWKTSPMLPFLQSPSWVSLSFLESFLSLLPRLVITLCVCSQSRSTLFNLVEPTSLLCPWSFPGKNTGVGCHFLLQGIFWPRDWTLISYISR